MNRCCKPLCLCLFILVAIFLRVNETLSALLREADIHLAPHRSAEGPSGLLCKAKASVVANIARSQWPPWLQTRGAAVCVWRQSYKIFRVYSGAIQTANSTLSEALPLVSLTQGDNSFLTGNEKLVQTSAIQACLQLHSECSQVSIPQSGVKRENWKRKPRNPSPLTLHPSHLTYNLVTFHPSPAALKKTVIFLYVCG